MKKQNKFNLHKFAFFVFSWYYYITILLFLQKINSIIYHFFIFLKYSAYIENGEIYVNY